VSLEYRTPSAEELATVLRTTYAAFGEEAKEDDIERWAGSCRSIASLRPGTAIVLQA